jgi:hypothetical protein
MMRYKTTRLMARQATPTTVADHIFRYQQVLLFCYHAPRTLEELSIEFADVPAFANIHLTDVLQELQDLQCIELV